MMMSDVRKRMGRLVECCYPMSLLSGNRAAEALDSLKVYTLNPGEAITLRPGRASDFLYVLEGNVEVKPANAEVVHLDPAATHERAFRLSPEMAPVTVSAITDTVVCRADGEVMDYLLSWETLSGGEEQSEDFARDRISAVRRSLAFRRLPLESVEEAFRRMTPLPVGAGADVVRQGDPGDAFYLIDRGRAEVWQTGIYDDEPKLVAELGPGDAFGEEALILRGSRNATVRMAEDGLLLVLGHEDFDELFHKNLIQRVQPSVAKALIDAGHGVLDVRYEEEFEDSRMPGCTLIPLHELRARVHELDPTQRYVVYCKGGGRSAVGTLLLRQRGFEAVSLEGGLSDWPYEIEQG